MIKIFFFNSKNNKIIFINKLTGHTNSIRDIDLIRLKSLSLLASCSQDGYIRIWKIL